VTGGTWSIYRVPRGDLRQSAQYDCGNRSMHKARRGIQWPYVNDSVDFATIYCAMGRRPTTCAQARMSRLLIKLRHAPDDEIQDIRDLLKQHRIEFYETQAGPWGISAPGIWLQEDHQYDRAKALLDDYQENRFREKHAEYEELRRAGKHRTFQQNLLERPIQVLFYSLVAGLILYFSISPFFPEN